MASLEALSDFANVPQNPGTETEYILFQATGFTVPSVQGTKWAYLGLH